MKASSLITPALLSALVAGQWVYLWGLREDVHRLSRRVESLSSELARGRDAAPPAPVTVETLRAAVLATRSGEPAAPETDQRVRAAVVDELRRQREEDLRQAEAVAEEITQNMRQKVARELEAGDVEVARLEDLGSALQDTENELSAQSAAGKLSDEELREKHHRAWAKMDADVRTLLGSSKYARFEALRREHPEFARSLHAFRSAPDAPSEGQTALEASHHGR